jgi:hypothetical protein
VAALFFWALTAIERRVRRLVDTARDLPRRAAALPNDHRARRALEELRRRHER